MIPDEIRGKLKRLSPYVGSYIPSPARENAKYLPNSDNYTPGWNWSDGSGFYQCEMELCDLDVPTIDPVGYVSIRPLEQGKYLLEFLLVYGGTKGFDPEDLIFDTMQEAKRYLDALLAADTPELPT